MAWTSWNERQMAKQLAKTSGTYTTENTAVADEESGTEEVAAKIFASPSLKTIAAMLALQAANNWQTQLRLTLPAGSQTGTLLKSLLSDPGAAITGGMSSNAVTSVLNPATAVNAIFRLVAGPNLAGIPLLATQESVSRQGEVSESPTLTLPDDKAEGTAQNQVYAMSNYVPRPRVWQVQGYIMANVPLFYEYEVHPDINLYLKLIDNYMMSRLPVMYKTTQNLFYKVLVTNFNYSWDVKAKNAVQVSLSLKEYVPLQLADAGGLKGFLQMPEV